MNSFAFKRADVFIRGIAHVFAKAAAHDTYRFSLLWPALLITKLLHWIQFLFLWLFYIKRKTEE